MNQFLSNKIIAGIVALALLVGVGVLVSSGDTSSTTRNAALVVATPCTKPGQVTKVSKQSVVCATTDAGSLWYATMKAKGKAQPCAKPGAIRQKSDIVWVCGVVKKKKLWQATQPLTALAVEGDLPSTTPATPDAPVNADNAVLADTKIPDDKIVPRVIDAATTPTTTPSTTMTTIPWRCAAGGTCNLRDIGPGGGIVFYVAPTPFKCGKDLKETCTYLEAAITNGTTPSTWTPSTTAQYGCYDTSVMTDEQAADSFEIGDGRAYTKIITAKNCIGTDGSASAASIAEAYNGGGKTDWFLPSGEELMALCLEFFDDPNSEFQTRCRGRQSDVTGTTGTISWSLAATGYWATASRGVDGAFYQSFWSGARGYTGKWYAWSVRPVRAFSQTTNTPTTTTTTIPTTTTTTIPIPTTTTTTTPRYTSRPTTPPPTTTTTTTIFKTACERAVACREGDVGPGGGNVFYVATEPFACGVNPNATAAPKCQYLEAAPNGWNNSDSDPALAWGGGSRYFNGVCSNKSIPGAVGTSIGSGFANTAAIMIACPDESGNQSAPAARAASSYAPSGKAGGWFLPSRDELTKLCEYSGRLSQAAAVGTGMQGATCYSGGNLRSDFVGSYYWSSSEGDATLAWGMSFNGGTKGGYKKFNADGFHVRPVRAF